MTSKQAKTNLSKAQLNAEKAWSLVALMRRELALAEANANIEDIKLDSAKKQLRNVLTTEE